MSEEGKRSDTNDESSEGWSEGSEVEEDASVLNPSRVGVYVPTPHSRIFLKEKYLKRIKKKYGPRRVLFRWDHPRAYFLFSENEPYPDRHLTFDQTLLDDLTQWEAEWRQRWTEEHGSEGEQPHLLSEKPHPLESEPCEQDPARVVLPLALAVVVPELPKELIGLIFDYVQSTRTIFQLRFYYDDGPDGDWYGYKRTHSLRELLTSLAHGLPTIIESGENDPEKGIFNRAFFAQSTFGHDPLTSGYLPYLPDSKQWQTILGDQMCANEYWHDPATAKQLLENGCLESPEDITSYEEQRKKVIESRGLVPKPVTQVRLYQRLQARLTLGRVPHEKALQWVGCMCHGLDSCIGLRPLDTLWQPCGPQRADTLLRMHEVKLCDTYVTLHETPLYLTQASLDSLPDCTRRTFLGERLYPLVRTLAPEDAGKITGMLLELDTADVLSYLHSQEALANRVKEALQILAEANNQ